MKKRDCPACGSASTRCATKQEEPAHTLVWRHFRVCRDCHTLFNPDSDKKIAHLVIGLGLWAIAMNAWPENGSIIGWAIFASSGLVAILWVSMGLSRVFSKKPPRRIYGKITPTAQNES